MSTIIILCNKQAYVWIKGCCQLYLKKKYYWWPYVIGIGHELDLLCGLTTTPASCCDPTAPGWRSPAASIPRVERRVWCLAREGPAEARRAPAGGSHPSVMRRGARQVNVVVRTRHAAPPACAAAPAHFPSAPAVHSSSVAVVALPATPTGGSIKMIFKAIFPYLPHWGQGNSASLLSSLAGGKGRFLDWFFCFPKTYGMK